MPSPKAPSSHTPHRPGFTRPDPARPDFQYLEELATAYWYSEVLFSAIELDLFTHIARGQDTLEKLATSARCHPGELKRLMTALETLALVGRFQDHWFNPPATQTFLVSDGPQYMGEFFLYRKYMRPRFQELTEKTGREEAPARTEIRPLFNPDLSYEERNHAYVSAMDTLARQKAVDIARLIQPAGLSGRALDIGGGAGTLLRTLMKETDLSSGLLVDLPEVIDSARRLYPASEDWEGMETRGGDFRSLELDPGFDLIILGNFLHAYGPEEARPLLNKALDLLAPEGMLLIHDYFPDRPGAVPQKGALYDLAMMLNTYNGACHTIAQLTHWLGDRGISDDQIQVLDLPTDSSILLACKDRPCPVTADPWPHRARALGLAQVQPISPDQVVTTPLARTKCQFGCEGFGKNLQCPPRGMDHQQTREMLDSFSRAYLVQGTPPGKDFHNQLLSLEKQAFLEGYHKAFVMGAGPCPICPACPEDGSCRSPHLARPAMEASGIDVYETARALDWDLDVVRDPLGYVKYIGLLLLE